MDSVDKCHLQRLSGLVASARLVYSLFSAYIYHSGSHLQSEMIVLQYDSWSLEAAIPSQTINLLIVCLKFNSLPVVMKIRFLLSLSGIRTLRETVALI